MSLQTWIKIRDVVDNEIVKTHSKDKGKEFRK